MEPVPGVSKLEIREPVTLLPEGTLGAQDLIVNLETDADTGPLDREQRKRVVRKLQRLEELEEENRRLK